MRPRLEALAQEGTLELVVPAEGSLPRLYGDAHRVRVLPYEPLTVPRGPLEGLRALRRFRREVRRFRRELRRARPDLVVVVTAVLPAALLAARLEGLPTVVYVGEIFAKGHVDGRLRALGGRLNARLCESLADRLVCCSMTVAEQFNGRATTATIYPGVSQAYVEGDGSAFRAQYGLEQAKPLIAVVGNLGAARAQDTALRALVTIRERLPGAQLVVVGLPHPRPVDERFAADLHHLAVELNVERSVVFTGFVEQIADVYAAADVVVNPARFNEPFGRVAVEALAAGRPVVASSVGAIPEVLRDGRDALLVPPEDPQALAAGVVRLTEDPGLAARLVAEGGRRVRRRFDEASGVESFERVVAELLAERETKAT